MSNGGRCCLLQICCKRPASVAAWEKVFVKAGLSQAEAAMSAEAAVSEIDAMGDLEDAIKRMKQEHPKGE
jgi:hypothetical protein